MRAHRWRTRLRDHGTLVDRAPGGNPVHRLLYWAVRYHLWTASGLDTRKVAVTAVSAARHPVQRVSGRHRFPLGNHINHIVLKGMQRGARLGNPASPSTLVENACHSPADTESAPSTTFCQHSGGGPTFRRGPPPVDLVGRRTPRREPGQQQPRRQQHMGGSTPPEPSPPSCSYPADPSNSTWPTRSHQPRPTTSEIDRKCR